MGDDFITENNVLNIGMSYNDIVGMNLKQPITGILNNYGYGEGEETYVWDEMWQKKAAEFGDFGLKDEPQMLALLYGDGDNGLFFTSKDGKKQIKLAKEFVEEYEALYFTPEATVAANAQRILQGVPRLDSPGSPDGWSFQCFIEYGYIKTADGGYVPDANVYYDSLFGLDWSNGDARSYGGVRFAVGKKWFFAFWS